MYRLDRRDIGTACEATSQPHGHALGNVRRNVAEKVTLIADWNPPFAFTHVLHYMLEQSGKIPTWLEFIHFIRGTNQGRNMLGWASEAARSEALRALDPRGQQRWSPSEVDDALRWRLGNAYYSFVRELHVLVHMRSKGLDVRVHPLADALFRTDAWVSRAVFSIYVGNRKYRSNHEGRKKEAVRILGGAQPSFCFESIHLPSAAERGKVYLASESQLEARLRKLLP
ncbi:hypothetical protein [Streptacidiphilus neutrinimicus]|uniref:hypothetical protein n=1 Tax=Streptacidiphilus neutrinimicus TaxID=105420 RepID=UPI001269E00D|nr:hypothetical protein [Streptacidiphilus neutrinimicus]